MGSRACLAALTLLWAQKPYRPFTLALSPSIPIGAWGASKRPFPKDGYARYSHGFYLAKEYYNRRGILGWFVFFQAISWQMPISRLIQSRLPLGIEIADTIPILRLPFSNVGGFGIIYRQQIGEKSYLTIPLDLRIAYVGYPLWSVPLKGGGEARLLVESNSYLGIGISPSFWYRIDPIRRLYAGGGIGYAFIDGRPSYYNFSYTLKPGEVSAQRESYYLPPRYVEIRGGIAFEL